VLLFATALGLLFFNRVAVLESIGEALLVRDEIKGTADLIVVLRGGTNFERLLEAFELYKEGKGRKICVAKSLDDEGSQVLERFGVQWPTEQQEYTNILMALGIPEKDIILDGQRAGGGTFGEALRIKRLNSELAGVKSIVVVTSWWHTRKTRMIYRKVFEGSGTTIVVHPAMRFSASKPWDWWKYRYQAMAVMQEYAKIAAYFFRGVFGFYDDHPQKMEKERKLADTQVEQKRKSIIVTNDTEAHRK